MNKNKIKLLAASAILAGNIVLLPGCYQSIDNNEPEESKIGVLDELNALSYVNADYLDQKRIEKIYACINDDSVKVKQILGQTDSNDYTFYTTGGDVMVIIQGEKPMVWFSSNVTPSDAYSAIASYNEAMGIMYHEFFDYLNPRNFRYFVNESDDDISVSYNEGGKLEISVKGNANEIVVCEVTPSKVKNLNDKETEGYILKQEVSYNIPDYAFMTLRCTEELPSVYMKDSDTLCVSYRGNDYETYIGFAETDFSSIPFFEFMFNSLNRDNSIIHRA